MSTEIGPIDLSNFSYIEALLRGPGRCYQTLKKYPIRLRTNYEVLSYLMLDGSKWVEFFEDEHSTFLMVVTPAGRVQVVVDDKLPPGDSYYEFRDGAEVKVYLAY